MNSDKLNLEKDIKRATELIDKLQKTEYNAWLNKYVSKFSCPFRLIVFLSVILATKHWIS